MQFYESSTDHCAHLGNLFVATGNTELNNRVVSYMMNQKVFVIKTFYSSGDSCVPLTKIWNNSFTET
jgi:hypothetical protein